MNGCRCDLHGHRQRAAALLVELRARGLAIRPLGWSLWASPSRLITDADRAVLPLYRDAMWTELSWERRN